MGAQERVVDHAALAINQASIITLVLVAFVADQHWLVAAVAVIMLAGTAVPALAVFKQLYRRVLRPLKLVVPRPRQDNPEPHAFSQLLGGVFLAGSYAALWLGWWSPWRASIYLPAFVPGVSCTTS